MKLFVVCRRELRSYFSSYIAYVLLAVFLLLTGGFFYSWLRYFILFGGYVLPSGLWQQVFMDMRYCAMIVLPLLTMRLFAEERRQGTIELLLTYPIRDGELLAAKFLACALVCAGLLAATLLYPWYLSTIQPLPLAPLLIGYTGLYLLGLSFVACGLFVSSLTESQVIAAVGTLGLLLGFWVLTWNEAASSPQLLRGLAQLSMFDHFEGFARGAIDADDITYFVGFVVFFNFCTLRVLEARTWRGRR